MDRYKIVCPVCSTDIGYVPTTAATYACGKCHSHVEVTKIKGLGPRKGLAILRVRPAQPELQVLIRAPWRTWLIVFVCYLPWLVVSSYYGSAFNTLLALLIGSLALTVLLWQLLRIAALRRIDQKDES